METSHITKVVLHQIVVKGRINGNLGMDKLGQRCYMIEYLGLCLRYGLTGGAQKLIKRDGGIAGRQSWLGKLWYSAERIGRIGMEKRKISHGFIATKWVLKGKDQNQNSVRLWITSVFCKVCRSR